MARRPQGLLVVAALLAVAAPCAPRAGSLALSDFEAGLAGRDEYRAAQAELAIAEALASREAGNGGLRATGTLAAGALSEPQYLGGRRDYGTLSASAGLRYPILGSAAEERLRVASARLDAAVARARREAARAALLRQLRGSFFGYARASGLAALAEAFLADADRIREVLRRRQGAGLVLESDRRQAESALAVAERHRQAALEEQRLRGAELRRWRGDFDGELVLPAPAAVRVAGNADLAEAAARRVDVDALRALEPSLPRPFTSARGSLFVTGTVRRDFDLGTGGGVLAGLTLDLPLGRDALAGLTGERDARAEQARLALAQAQEEQRTAARAAAAGAERSAAERKLARARVAATGAALAEAARRAALAGGAEDAPIERWLAARADHFGALVSLLEAEHDEALSAALLELAAGGASGIALERATVPECRQAASALLSWRTLEAGAVPAVPPCDETAAAAGVPRAFYAWSGLRVLDRAADEAFWRGTRASELWVSFTRRQLEELRQPAARAALRAAIARVQRGGRRVALLLGEPSWLRPEQEERLFALVRELADLPFDALHLDVEPGQLAPPLPPEQAWPALARLVARTREIARRPIILSLNWRELMPDAGGLCRGCAAARAADEVAVMLYATAPDLVAERMRSILAERPARRVWLAQSIEPGLGPGESFASRGRAALDEQLGRLAPLAREPAFAGFAVQSLEDFLEVRP